VRILVRMMFLKAFNFLIVTIERAKTMSNHLELLGMDHDDDSFDNDRDDWQDDLAGEGIPTPSAEAILLAGVSLVALLCAGVLVCFEAWRILTNG